ncbi:FAD-dependent oxidoreductase [uncultured Alsobacter sp.]|uniref:oxidoreductase n=1 Tax=uncultured Alsobacter sp. TaxID=1748258 RepID=UPI0025EA3440|nr:FAD-dependent oxidoreductase [uncultured Alsobacter sp.]
MPKAFAHLLSPGRIGTLQTRNRIVMSAMGSDLSGEEGRAGDRIVAYYAARAAGGAGLIVTEAVPVAYPSGYSRPHALALADEVQRQAARALVAAVQRHGARIAMQLNHHGPLAKRDMLSGQPLLVPSEPEPGPRARQPYLPDEADIVRRQWAGAPPVTYTALSRQDIAALLDHYAEAARHVRDVGADAIEIHAAHGFLLSSFLSPRSNRRTDDYGGSTQARARLLLEVIRAVRDGAGIGFPIWCKLDTQEHDTPGGITLADAIETARLAQAEGIAAIMASCNANLANPTALTRSNIPDEHEWMVGNATALRKALDIPVITAGRIGFARANALVRRGAVDFIAFGRPMLADPDFPNKLAGNREADVRPCVYCYACISQLSFDEPVKCAVNPATGREAEVRVVPATRPFRIAVAGGGPAGLEVTRRLALAGHHVSLFDTGAELGGTLRFAALAYPPNEKLLRWLTSGVQHASVDVRLRHRFDAVDALRLRPDAIVLATGMVIAQSDIPGAELPHVFDGARLRALAAGADPASPMLCALGTIAGWLGVRPGPAGLRRLARVWTPFGRRVVVIGGDLVGLELAEFLSHHGHAVAVVHRHAQPGRGLYLVRRAAVLDRLRRGGVSIITDAQDVRIEDGWVAFRDVGERKIEADSVIIAEATPDHPASPAAFADLRIPVHEIGDRVALGYIEGALASAARVARDIGG